MAKKSSSTAPTTDVLKVYADYKDKVISLAKKNQPLLDEAKKVREALEKIENKLAAFADEKKALLEEYVETLGAFASDQHAEQIIAEYMETVTYPPMRVVKSAPAGNKRIPKSDKLEAIKKAVDDLLDKGETCQFKPDLADAYCHHLGKDVPIQSLPQYFSFVGVAKDDGTYESHGVGGTTVFLKKWKKLIAESMR